ncbi:MAG: hypothetical protein ACR2K1_08045 [Saprospiraceae bacterium]
MKTTVSVYDFRDAFQKIRPDNFSYDGLRVLFEYFEQLEDDIGEEMELDVIGICCDFAESDWRSIAADYSIEIDENENEEEQEAQVLDYLADHDVLIGQSETGIVYRKFYCGTARNMAFWMTSATSSAGLTINRPMAGISHGACHHRRAPCLQSRHTGRHYGNYSRLFDAG